MPALVLASLLLSALPGGVQELGPPPYARVRYAVEGLNLQAGDLDGDGDVDLVDCNRSDLVVLWNSGAGWFERIESLGIPAESAAIGDLDGDGDADLVAALGNEVHVLLADGLGSFTVHGTAPLQGEAADMLLGDLDGDGSLDLVAVCTGNVQVLLGDGQGGFRTSSSIVHAPGAFAGALGDLDEDGRLDLVVDPRQQLFLGDGQGGFRSGGVLDAFGFPNDSGRPHLADLDGDGHLDLLTFAYYGGMDVLFGDGQGSFSAATNYHAGPYVAVEDVDGDGDLDVLSKSPGGQDLVLWTNDGSGTLTQQPDRLHLLGSCNGLDQLRLVDLDGDGDLDLVSAGHDGILVLPGDGAGWFEDPPTLPGITAAYVQLADVDGDGLQDLVCSANGVTTYLGDGQGGLGAPLVTALPPAGELALGDLDEDGILDLATSCSVAPLICFGDGTGRFPGVYRPTYDYDLKSTALADVNGDGHLDVAYACRGMFTGVAIRLLLGDGTGGFVPSGVPGTEQPEGIALGDLDGDGDVDILAGFYERIDVYLGDGTGSFTTSFSLPLRYRHVSAVGIADLDGDGRPELLIGLAQMYGLRVFWGEPGGGYSPPEVLESTERIVTPRDLAVADVDGDGVAELLVTWWGDTYTALPGGVAVLRPSGPRELRWTWTFGHGDEPWSLALGDLDQDGHLDLATAANHIVYDPWGAHYEVPGVVQVLLNQLPPEAPCTGEVSYCVAKLNSAGCLPRICSSGTPSLTGPDDFVVSAERVVSHRPGLLIWSLTPAGLPFQGGMLCLAPPIVRTGLLDSGGTTGLHDCSGVYAYGFTQSTMLAKGLTAGTQVFAQYWSRDTAQPPPATPTGLTDGLSFTIQP